MRTALITILVLLLAGTLLAQTAAKPTIQKVAAKYSTPSSGQTMFNDYCASCHGSDGKGNGPAAAAMKSVVPDLTVLAKKNGGEFPGFHIGQTIIGEKMMSAHGSKDMPVWGPVFSRLSQQSRAETQLRVYNLTNYVESLQSR
jgi:mono/diheme cytochrome c family protein